MPLRPKEFASQKQGRVLEPRARRRAATKDIVKDRNFAMKRMRGLVGLVVLERHTLEIPPQTSAMRCTSCLRAVANRSLDASSSPRQSRYTRFASVQAASNGCAWQGLGVPMQSRPHNPTFRGPKPCVRVVPQLETVSVTRPMLTSPTLLSARERQMQRGDVSVKGLLTETMIITPTLEQHTMKAAQVE